MSFLISLISGVLILDKYAIGIFGFSQPIVSGMIFGLVFGDLKGFLILGSFLQLIYLSMLPIGRSIPPDGELGGITGLAIHALYPGMPIVVPFFFAVAASIFSGYTDVVFRQFNNILYRKGISAAKKGNISEVVNFHLLGLPVAFIRAFLTVFVMLTIAGFLKPAPYIWSSAVPIVPTAIGFASGLYLFFKKRHILYLIGGVAVGWVLQFLVS